MHNLSRFGAQITNIDEVLLLSDCECLGSLQMEPSHAMVCGATQLLPKPRGSEPEGTWNIAADAIVAFRRLPT